MDSSPATTPPPQAKETDKPSVRPALPHHPAGSVQTQQTSHHKASGNATAPSNSIMKTKQSPSASNMQVHFPEHTALQPSSDISRAELQVPHQYGNPNTTDAASSKTCNGPPPKKPKKQPMESDGSDAKTPLILDATDESEADTEKPAKKAKKAMATKAKMSGDDLHPFAPGAAPVNCMSAKDYGEMTAGLPPPLDFDPSNADGWHVKLYPLLMQYALPRDGIMRQVYVPDGNPNLSVRATAIKWVVEERMQTATGPKNIAIVYGSTDIAPEGTVRPAKLVSNLFVKK